MKKLIISWAMSVTSLFGSAMANTASAPTILCLGDSITEGKDTFKVYREPLKRMLQAADYEVEFIGPKKSYGSNHAGYRGKDTAFLDDQFAEIYRSYPADIVLIHSVHNAFADQKPIPGIIANLESILRKAQSANPNVTVLLAMGITSGKLPKYSYIPELNIQIVELVKRMNTAQQRVVLVDQADGFSWKTDTIKDRVHPNARGAEKMAQKWFDALIQLPLLKPPLAAKVKQDRPNIMVILLDDAGYNDFGFMGSTAMKTPNIDRLAASGVICSDAHTSGTTCSPSRAGIMTGRYQQRFGHHENIPPYGMGMDPAEKTMGDAFKAGGYKTIYVGKWHLGDLAKHYPTNRGWDEFVGLREGSRSYFRGKNEKLGNPKAIEHNGKSAQWDGYLTDFFTDVAVDYLKQTKDTPFCLFLSYTAPHTPMHAKKEHLEKFKGHPRQKLAAMLWSVDEGVGRILQRLEELNLRDNTLIFFLSDNGGSSASTSDNGPLKGFKGTKFEGGQRVPFVVSWPAKIPAGGTYKGLASALDIYATSAIAIGAPLDLGKPLDGVNLLPYLQGEKEGEPHEVLYWSRSIEDAIRMGDYKLIGHENHGWRLYNLEEDIGEMNDLTKQHPEKVQEMKKLYLAWEKGLADAQWPSAEKWVKLKAKAYGELLNNMEPNKAAPEKK